MYTVSRHTRTCIFMKYMNWACNAVREGSGVLCDERDRVFVCLPACLSVCCPFAYLQNHKFSQTSPNFPVLVARGRVSVLHWQRCDMLRTSGFVGGVSNLLVLK